MKNTFLKYILIVFVLGSVCSCKQQAAKNSAFVMITTPDQSKLLSVSQIGVGHYNVQAPVITVNTAQEYQKIDGFGYTLTGGSAMHLSKMSSESRKALLHELFGSRKEDISVSYLRLSIGGSDLDEKPFSYSELPEGEIDPELTSFSMAYDQKYLIPVLKEILQINPEIKLMGSPWSPPKWMKDNKDTRGGSLMPQFYQAYANYFVKYIEEMESEGIKIDAITVQNEPLHPGNNPSLLMLAEEQATFVKNHLGPTFKKEGIETKIVIYDHNADRPDYPISILNDPEANQYIDGSAFHLYGGEIEALTQVHEAHPNKNLYFTEQWVGAPGDFPDNFSWHVRELIIGATRNWSKTVLEWNLSSNPELQPHTDRGGCTSCLGAVTIKGNEVVRNPAYYIIAHASKYVSPGSVRIGSNMPENLPNVVFKTPKGNFVVIVMNEYESPQTFTIDVDGRLISGELPAGAAGTFVLG